MQGLVAVALGVIHPVANPVRLVAVYAGDYGEDMVTLIPFPVPVGGIHIKDYAHGIEVIYLVKSHVLGGHLVPYGIWCLNPLLDAVAHSRLGQGLVDRPDERLYGFILVVYGPVDQCGDLVVSRRFLVPEPDVLHLRLHLV